MMNASEEFESRMRAYLSATTIAEWLNFKADMIEGAARYQLRFHDRHIGNPAIRAIHGGAVAAFLELAAGCELAGVAGMPAQAISVDVDYLASARDEDMFASARILRLGRRLAFVEANGWQRDETKPVATLRARFRFVDYD